MSLVPSPEDAKPRPSPFGGGLTPRQVGAQEWHVRPDLAGDVLGPTGLRLDEWLARGTATVVKTGPHRTVYRLSLPSGIYYLKHYKLTGPRSWLQNNLRPCRAYREAAANLRVTTAGLATAEMVAVGRIRRGSFSQDSFFVTREIPGVVPLDEFLIDQGVKVQPSVRRAVTMQVALMTAALHRSSLYHADYHAGNLLARPEAAGLRLWLIDLHPLRAARMTVRRRWTMLGMLASSFAPHATRGDRRRFFAAYSAVFGVDEDVRTVESACEKEVHVRQERADRKWRRGNRRVVILDGEGVACRGLAELGREMLVRLRDEVTRAGEAGRRNGSALPAEFAVRYLPPGASARDAWEIGHALLRRGFPVARPVLFASDSSGGVVVTDRSVDELSLTSWFGGSAARDSSHDVAAALGRLLRRLHDAGFDPEPGAFSITVEGQVALSRPERVLPRGMTFWRRRKGLSWLLGELPLRERPTVAANYGNPLKVLRPLASWFGFAGSRPAASRAVTSVARRRVAAMGLIAVAASVGLLAGCRSLDKPPEAPILPAKHSVRADHLLLVSDFKLPPNDPLVTDLVKLRTHVSETLRLPEPRQDVTVYLFSNEESYRRYLNDVHPGLPPRRAYFVGTKNDLAVYTYWGDRVLEDLRHEYTHGILHASLSAVPLWLDEGLAEYFEVPGKTPGAMNGDYPQQLAVAVSRGWRPDIERLEQLEEFSKMRRLDYQESWAWVHYLLHASPDTRQALLAYVEDLRDASHPPALSDRVAAVEPSYTARFLGYVATLNSTGGAVIRAASAEL